jgi:hypothetical protein
VTTLLHKFALTFLLGLLLLVGAMALGARTSSDEEAPQLDLLATGSVSISNSHAGQAIVSAANIVPGDSASGTVSISNTGSAPGALSLALAESDDTLGRNGGVLSRLLELEVTEITSGPSTPIYSGVLAEMPAQDLPILPAGAQRTYQFSVLMPDGGAPEFNWSEDNRFQRASSRFAYEWTLTGDGAIPVDPEPQPNLPVAPDDAMPLPPDACVTELVGDSANNRLSGTVLGDWIHGLAGSDWISAGDGDDCVDGGRGADRLRGGVGDDLLIGGPGDDRIRGGSGDDSISVRGGGYDLVNCGSGDDRASAGPRDRLRRC